MSSAEPVFTETADPAVAKAWFADLTATHPQALSVIGSVADGLLSDPLRYRDPRWWAGRVTDGDGEVVAAFMHTPPHPLHVGLATPDWARALAAHLAARHHQLPGVGGDRAAAEAFAAAWTTVTDAAARTAMQVGVYDLPVAPVLPHDVDGRFRTATLRDLPLVDAWSRSFVREVHHGSAQEPVGEPAETPSLAPAVADRRVGLWVVGSRAVSMAMVSRPNGGVARVSGVWTPPELRGHGYASAVVATMSRLRVEAGERCLLFTDLANPTSNSIYRRIGYRRVGDNVSIEFD